MAVLAPADNTELDALMAEDRERAIAALDTIRIERGLTLEQVAHLSRMQVRRVRAVVSGATDVTDAEWRKVAAAVGARIEFVVRMAEA